MGGGSFGDIYLGVGANGEKVGLDLGFDAISWYISTGFLHNPALMLSHDVWFCDQMK